MALKNPETNEYYKVEKENVDVIRNTIIVLEYKDVDHRQNGDTKRLKKNILSVYLPWLFDAVNEQELAEVDLSFKDFITTIAYWELKKQSEYEGYEDC